MKKRFAILALLLFPALVWGDTLTYIQGVVGVESGGGEGPDTWYYPANITENSDDAMIESGWGHATYLYGNKISVGQAGTATKLSAKFYSFSTSENVKMGLYDSSGDLLSQCNVNITDTMPGQAWFECTINTSVTATDYYVFSSLSSSTSYVRLRYTSGVTGYYTGECLYSNAMCSSVTPASEANGFAARLYVD